VLLLIDYYCLAISLRCVSLELALKQLGEVRDTERAMHTRRSPDRAPEEWKALKIKIKKHYQWGEGGRARKLKLTQSFIDIYFYFEPTQNHVKTQKPNRAKGRRRRGRQTSK
jgi:hypothetical protein